MDLAEMDKFRAMKAGRRSGQYRLMTVIVQYGLRVLTLGLFLSSFHWLPVVRCSVQSLFVVSLPGITGVLMRPLAFFIIANVIVIFLICESKLSSSSLRPDIYEEYVVQSQNLQKAADSAPTLVEEEKSWVALESGEEDKEEKCGEEEEAEMDTECNDNEEDEEEDEDGGEEEDELNRRFEDFIARVNMQRKLEAARMLV